MGIRGTGGERERERDEGNEVLIVCSLLFMSHIG